MKIKYNYNKLKGRIKEYYDTQESFGKSINLSATSINNKLNNRVPFTQDEIFKSISNLHILSNEIQEIFFTQEVEKN